MRNIFILIIAFNFSASLSAIPIKKYISEKANTINAILEMCSDRARLYQYLLQININHNNEGTGLKSDTNIVPEPGRIELNASIDEELVDLFFPDQGNNECEYDEETVQTRQECLTGILNHFSNDRIVSKRMSILKERMAKFLGINYLEELLQPTVQQSSSHIATFSRSDNSTNEDSSSNIPKRRVSISNVVFGQGCSSSAQIE